MPDRIQSANNFLVVRFQLKIAWANAGSLICEMSLFVMKGLAPGILITRIYALMPLKTINIQMEKIIIEPMVVKSLWLIEAGLEYSQRMGICVVILVFCPLTTKAQKSDFVELEF